MRIGMVYDLRDDYLAAGFTEEEAAEFDEERTVAAIESALRESGHAPERVGHGRRLAERLAAGERWDLVFSFAEGLSGRCREAQVPALLELYGQPYAFSDPLVCAATLDKAVAKRLAVASGLATAGFRVVRRESDAAAVDLPFPLFVKPLCEGTGKGVDEKSRVADRAQLVSACRDLLARFRQPVLVEEYLPGREFTTGILGTGDEARVLGTLEVRIRSSAPAADYTHEIKENWQRHVEYDTPTPGPLLTEVENLALACYRCLECRDTARVDMRLDARGRPAFMEVNPLPGLNPGHSDLPMIAERAGLTYRELIAAIVDSAARRNGAGHGAASHTRRTP